MTLQRYALLVESWNGVPTAPIHSAKKDLEDWNNFLRSCLGGAWSGCEILPLHSPLKESFLANVESLAQKNDFLFVTFSGHGGRDAEGDYINISPNQIVYVNEIMERIPDGVSTTIILDACRSFHSLQEQMSSLNSDEDVDYDVAASLQIWEHSFETLRPGHVLIQSCSAKQFANSGAYSSENGFYTRSMIEAAKKWARETQYGCVLNTYKAFLLAKKYMKQNYGDLVDAQIPQYTPSEKITNPFAVNAKITTSLFGPQIL